MDRHLLSWAWARRHHHCRAARDMPVLWLFTDSHRLPDPRRAVAHLPRGLAGVVFRHDDTPNRLALGQDLARLCRARRVALVVAGDPRLAARLGAGVHLRRGRWPGLVRVKTGLVTSSAHSGVDLCRARRAGAHLVFLSPAFSTRSHPGAPALGPVRWTALARMAGLPVAALGGIDGVTVRRLPAQFCRAVAAITALAPPPEPRSGRASIGSEP
jgi:thiamine-phosphate pyrophosphorylase